jgi:hypothetical protein
MQGPSLTPQQAVTSIARRVLRAEADGLDRDLAIRRTSIGTGIDAEKVRWCVETVLRESPVRALVSARRRRAALAIAAVL